MRSAIGFVGGLALAALLGLKLAFHFGWVGAATPDDLVRQATKASHECADLLAQLQDTPGARAASARVSAHLDAALKPATAFTELPDQAKESVGPELLREMIVAQQRLQAEMDRYQALLHSP